jgi:heme a synthase
MTRLVSFALSLTLCTIVLGAYTRLTDAGLGCPDWPGCYGFMAAPTQPAQLSEAQQRYPMHKVEPHKAHNEMLHRYLAGSLGLAILAIFILSWWRREQRLLSSGLLALVVMQAALGMLTVSLNLLPLVVLGHLLGGFSLLCLLALLRLRLSNINMQTDTGLTSRRPLAWCALLILVLQISLGAWTSANYAALACHQLPVCEAGWQARFDLASAFHLPMGQETYQYGVLSYDARMSIHILHRLGALVTALMIMSLVIISLRRARTHQMRLLAIGLGILLCLQITLGLINVIAWLPLFNAVAHNFVAANLLMLLVVFIECLYRQRPVVAKMSREKLQFDQRARHYSSE